MPCRFHRKTQRRRRRARRVSPQIQFTAASTLVSASGARMSIQFENVERPGSGIGRIKRHHVVPKLLPAG